MSGALSLDLSEETRARLEWVSQRVNRPVTDCAQAALEEYLDDMEDYFLAVEAREEIQRTGVVYTQAQMREILGLDD